MISVSGASDAMALPPAGAWAADAAASGWPPTACLRLRRRRGPFFSTASSPEDAPRRVVNAILPPSEELGRNFTQHFQTGHARGDFTQRCDRGFVTAFEIGRAHVLTTVT